MEIRLLGPLEVAADARVLELGGGRQRALLVVLALRPNQVVSTDSLIDALWGDAAPPTALKALQGLVSQLRRALAPLGGEVIATRSPGYVLDVDPDTIDAHRFERLATLGRQEVESDPRSAAETLREALGLWRGEALAEFAYEPFAQAATAHLAEVRLEAFESLFDAELELGRHGEVTAELQALVSTNPLRERLRGQLMLALYRSGRQADALEAYRDGREVLDQELGLEPDVELRRLEQAILAQDPALGRVEKTRPQRSPTVRRRRRLVLVVVAAAAACAVAAGAFAVADRGEKVPALAPNSLVKIDVETGEIEDVIPVGRDPGQVVIVGPYVFVTSEEDETLHRLDTRTGDVETSGANATDGALVADGEFLWATSRSRAEVVRIHAESMRATDRIPLPRDLLFAFVAVGAGSLWISHFPPAAVLRLDLQDQRLERGYYLAAYASPPVETTFADGASWTAVGAELLRIDAGTGERESIAAGSLAGDPEFGFGSMWAGSGEGAVWRIDPITGRTTATVPAGKVTFGLAADAGSLWVTNYCDGTVSRIDPTTNSVAATFEVGYQPKWLAVDDDHAWVGVSGTMWEELGCDDAVRP